MKKERILDSIDYEDYYRELVPSLTGNTQCAGRCPFPDHEDKNPSFSVDLNSGLYCCHGCGRRGDIFTFHQELKGVDFKAALEDLAALTNIQRRR